MAVRSLTMNTHHHHHNNNNNSTNKSNSTIHNNNNNNNNNNTVRNRLFVDDDEDDDDPTKHDNNKNNNRHISRHHGRCGKTPSILNPIDLNLDFAELGPSTTTVLAASASAAYDDEDDNGSTPPRLSRRTSTLTPHPPSRPFTARTKKRSAEQHDLYGKEWNCTTNNNHNHNDDDVFSAMESPVDMYTSPRVSSPSSPSHNSRTTTGPGGGGGGGNSHTPCNSNYSNKSSGRMSIHRGSPFLYGGGGGNAAGGGGGGQRTHNTPNNMLQSHKSPSSFQTLDGRTVQSKNPFSPMIFDVSLTPTQKHHLYLSSRNNSPAIPPMFANNDLSFPLGCGDDNDNNNGDDGDGGNNNNNNGSSSFGSGGTTGKGGGGPRRGSHLVLRHKLQKRPSSPANSNGVGVGVTGHIGIQHQHHLHQPIAAASAASVSANNNNMGIGIGMDGLMPPPLPSKDIIINKNIKVNNSNINNNINNSTSRDPLEQRASLYVRDGYPEKKGRYSFTGSPIKEQLEPTSAAAASSSSSSSTYIAAAAAAQTNFTATGPSSALSSINTEMMSIKSKPSYQMNEEDEDVKEVVNTSICTEDDVTVTSTTQEDFCTNIHKIRRRRKDDDVVAAGAQGESSWKRNGMYIQTNSNSNSNNNDYYDNTNNANSNDDNNNNNDDEWGYYNNNNNRNNNNSKTYYYNKQRSDHPDDNISPTDVLNFPLFRASPSNTSDVPPAPSKPIRRPPSRRYTPIRKPTGPPPTPLPSVRNSRSFEEEDTAFLGRRNGNDNGDEDSSDDDDNGDDRISNVAQRRCRRLRPKSGGMDYLNLSPGVGGAGGEQTVGPPSSRFYSDFDVIAELGSGSFGNVYQALSRLDGCMYAIKVAHRAARGESDKDRMLKEVYALAALSDQADTATFHIVRYHQAWMEEQRLYIQTELCTTTLQAEIEQVAPMQLPLSTRYKCMREILLALEFIHRNGMVHLDIKPENIFVSS